MKKNIPDSEIEVDIEDFDEDVTSALDEYNTFMAALAFEAKKPATKTKSEIEHSKTYRFDGNAARVTVVTKTDSVGLEPDHPEYFMITLQMHIKADEKDVEKKCPEFCKKDLLKVLSMFDRPNPTQSIIGTTCETCGIISEDFIALDTIGNTCFDCARRLRKL